MEGSKMLPKSMNDLNLDVSGCKIFKHLISLLKYSHSARLFYKKSSTAMDSTSLENGRRQDKSPLSLQLGCITT
jgi:hypothetical protein